MAGTTGSLRSDLIDLSGVSLDELGEVSGLSDALTTLQTTLAHAEAPLCEADMAPSCGGAQSGPLEGHMTADS
jgi:hypothetical protein